MAGILSVFVTAMSRFQTVQNGDLCPRHPWINDITLVKFYENLIGPSMQKSV
jgi:hypothetical protein